MAVEARYTEQLITMATVEQRDAVRAVESRYGVSRAHVLRRCVDLALQQVADELERAAKLQRAAAKVKMPKQTTP